MAMAADGEALFESADRYVVNTTSTMNRGGQQHQSKMHVTATYLKADCGDIKPIMPAGQ